MLQATESWVGPGNEATIHILVPWLSQYMNFEPWLQASLLQIVTQCGGVHVPCLVTIAEISMMSTGETGFHTVKEHNLLCSWKLAIVYKLSQRKMI